jgi:hypothetical protein
MAIISSGGMLRAVGFCCAAICIDCLDKQSRLKPSIKNAANHAIVFVPASWHDLATARSSSLMTQKSHSICLLGRMFDLSHG